MELLVVIAVVAVLSSLLLPALVGAKERARRSACQSNLHQFLLAIHMYAGDNREQLPSGLSDNVNPVDEHIPVLSTNTHAALLQYSGSFGVLDCPNLQSSFKREKSWRVQSNYGFAIGYNYLGGHGYTPWRELGPARDTWTSPQSLNHKETVILLTDLNDWSSAFGKKVAAHGPSGPILKGSDYYLTHPEAHRESCREIGGAGGNLGFMDGSVRWRRMSEMKVYRGSQLWDESGCFAMW